MNDKQYDSLEKTCDTLDDASDCSDSKTPRTSTTAHTCSKRRGDLKWNGWGYKDSKFIVNKRGQVEFLGERYGIAGKCLPFFRPWMMSTLNIDLNFRTPSQPKPAQKDYPVPVRNERFLTALTQTKIPWSSDGEDRLFRAHGHTLSEINKLRTGKLDRIPGEWKITFYMHCEWLYLLPFGNCPFSLFVFFLCYLIFI